MRRFSAASAFVLGGLLLSGCAALTGTSDEVTVASEPPGAQCRVERMAQPLAQVAETPATVTIPRSSYPVDIFCTKDGLAASKTVRTGVNLMVYGDLLLGGVPYIPDSILDADRVLPETIVVRFR